MDRGPRAVYCLNCARLTANARRNAHAASLVTDSPLRDAHARMNYARTFRKAPGVPTCGHPEKKIGSYGKCVGCANRDRNRMRLGVSPVAFQERLMQQDWRCLICTTEINLSSSLDHDHQTGEVRGILCDRCNWLLGHAADDPDILRAGADYIEYHRDIDKARTA